MCRAKYGSDPTVTLTIIKIGGQEIDATQPPIDSTAEALDAFLHGRRTPLLRRNPTSLCLSFFCGRALPIPASVNNAAPFDEMR
jgi:hypothetical protein